ncbi:MAG: polyprenyl synthetase family protein [Prevotellaceae bacterium]|nr:polyprenyl synthetase family protein [Prevotellaceae bacterium]
MLTKKQTKPIITQLFVKTAILFALCMQGGAISTGGTDEQKRNLREFGENLGICFQIKDDIFDYTPKANIGKPIFNDIREGKITLPLIYALTQASENERKIVSEIIKSGDFIDKNIMFLHNLVSQYQGINYAEKKMDEFRTKACDCLNDFADNEVKKALLATLDYVLVRES